MPASRNARAMIFAPRSCPSRPGLATTTRIFCVVLGAGMARRAGILCLQRRRGPEGPRGHAADAASAQVTLSVSFMFGRWIVQKIVYVPAFVNLWEIVPFVLIFEIWPFCGPFVITTSCGRLPVHRNFTVSPRWMVSFDGPKLMLGPTLTVFVAASAGTATAAATAATATSSAMRRFIRVGASWFGGDAFSPSDAGRWCQLPGRTRVGSAGDRYGLEHRRLAVVAPDVLKRHDDLAPGAGRARRVEQVRHEVLALAGGRLAQARELALDAGAVAPRPDRRDALDLLALERGVDPQRRDLPVVLVAVGVDADDPAPAGVDLGLQLEARVGDLALREVLLDRVDHAAELVDPGEVLIRLPLELVGQRLDEVRAAERVDRVRHARLVGDDLLRAQRDAHRLLGRQRERLVVGVGVQRLRPTEHAGERLDRRASDVVERLLRRQRDARGLHVRAHEPRARVARAEGVAHLARPDPPGGAQLRDLLEEVDVRVEEEAQARGEVVDVEAAVDRLLHVREPVLERERELLRGRRARLADVVAADRDRMPARHRLRAPLDHVAQEAHGRVDREAPLLLGDVLLEDVGLDRAAQVLGPDALVFRRDDVVGEHDRRRSVDRHGHGDLAEVDAGEQVLHVVQRVDRDALAPDLAERHRVVGVVAHERGHVERRAQAGLAVVEQVAEALVRLLGGAEAGELAHRPQAAPVHARVHAAGEGIPAGKADLVAVGQVGLGVEGLDRDAGERAERRLALGRQRVRLAPLGLGLGNGKGRSHTESRTSTYLGRANGSGRITRRRRSRRRRPAGPAAAP